MSHDALVDLYVESSINNMLNILDSYEEKIMKLHYKVVYSMKELVEFINTNGIRKEDIQLLREIPRAFELLYWSESK